MRGRKPLPANIHRLRGNPGKRKLNDREPQPLPGIPEAPTMLSEAARQEWDRKAEALAEMGLLSRVDDTALAAYCTLYARWVQAEEQVRKFGTVVKSPEKGFPMKSPWLTVADQALEGMRKFLVEFGLTPSSRSRIHLPENLAEPDDFDLFLQEAG